jgi:dTDP-4-amino-4,6-dideoxygalactose transaminase
MVIHQLGERGVPSRPYFSPIHLQPFYREQFGYREGDFPIAEDLGKRSLSIPFSGIMTKNQIEYVCGTLRDVLANI